MPITSILANCTLASWKDFNIDLSLIGFMGNGHLIVSYSFPLFSCPDYASTFLQHKHNDYRSNMLLCFCVLSYGHMPSTKCKNFIYFTLVILSLFSLQHNYFPSRHLESNYRNGIRLLLCFCCNTDFFGYLYLSFSCCLANIARVQHLGILGRLCVCLNSNGKVIQPEHIVFLWIVVFMCVFVLFKDKQASYIN